MKLSTAGDAWSPVGPPNPRPMTARSWTRTGPIQFRTAPFATAAPAIDACAHPPAQARLAHGLLTARARLHVRPFAAFHGRSFAGLRAEPSGPGPQAARSLGVVGSNPAAPTILPGSWGIGRSPDRPLRPHNLGHEPKRDAEIEEPLSARVTKRVRGERLDLASTHPRRMSLFRFESEPKSFPFVPVACFAA